MSGKSAFPTLQLLHRSLSAHLGPIFHEVRLIAFVLDGMKLSFNHSVHPILSKSVHTSL
jgi:hypothetical protein